MSQGEVSAPVSVDGLVHVYDDVDGVDVDVDAVRAGIRASKLVGKSQLVGGFVHTRGFGLACHRAAWPEAVQKVPFLAPFVALALDDDRLHGLLGTSFARRLLGAFFGDVNALYVNVLVVPGGAAVEKHVDSTLGTRAGSDVVYVPRAVCVLYVDVPADLEGGALRLYDGERLVAEVTPQVGRLVLFRGHLAHEVTAASTSTTGARVSCVCELYALPRERLRGLPRVRLQSEGFADVLSALRGPGAATGEALASRDPAR